MTLEALDENLRVLAATAMAIPTDLLLEEAHVRYDPEPPSFQPFLIRVQEVLIVRYGLERASQMLQSLNRPRRDTMHRTTGNLPHDHSDKGRS
jgi:hypothetical protein